MNPNKYGQAIGNYSIDELSIIKSYLIDALSFRDIERNILEIDSQAHGGGFIAKGIINSYGIEAINKGMVTEENINELIANNTGQLKFTLEKLNEYLKTFNNTQ